MNDHSDRPTYARLEQENASLRQEIAGYRVTRRLHGDEARQAMIEHNNAILTGQVAYLQGELDRARMDCGKLNDEAKKLTAKLVFKEQLERETLRRLRVANDLAEHATTHPWAWLVGTYFLKLPNRYQSAIKRTTYKLAKRALERAES